MPGIMATDVNTATVVPTTRTKSVSIQQIVRCLCNIDLI